MKKRLQVFVSSTFEDLRLERQAAVEAILKAGHIPAGMELFTAGDESQMAVIRKWIDESDAFMLILGGRYGTIEPSSGKSYTEVEYDHALASGMPLFSVVLTDKGRDEKVKQYGTSVIESVNESLYRDFRKRVQTNMCAYYSELVEVKLAVHETLPRLSESRELSGWIRASDVQSPVDVAKELARVSAENMKLRLRVQELESSVSTQSKEAVQFEALRDKLLATPISVPQKVSKLSDVLRVPLLKVAILYIDYLARGVSNYFNVSDVEAFIYYDIASPLAVYGLVEHGSSPSNKSWQRLRLSKDGKKFFAWAQLAEAGAGPASETDSTDARNALAPPVKRDVDATDLKDERVPAKKAPADTTPAQKVPARKAPAKKVQKR